MNITKGTLAGWITLAASMTSACSGNRGSGDDAADVEEQACLDVAEGVAAAAGRCGGDYQANYDAFIDGAAEGDCANIVQVRDRAALYDECLPSLEVVSCDDLLAGQLDDSCRDQLLRLR